MSQIWMFGLENRTKSSLDFRHSDFVHMVRSVHTIVRYYYKRPKSKQIQSFSWSSWSTEHPKSEWNHLDFRHCLKSEQFNKQTKMKSAEIRMFGFQTFTVIQMSNLIVFFDLFQIKKTTFSISFDHYWKFNWIQTPFNRFVQWLFGFQEFGSIMLIKIQFDHALSPNLSLSWYSCLSLTKTSHLVNNQQ